MRKLTWVSLLLFITFYTVPVSAQIPQSNSVIATVTYDATWPTTTSGSLYRTRTDGGNLTIDYYSSTTTTTYWPAGSYYQTDQPCTYAITRYSSVYYPPNGGTFLRAYSYCLWAGNCSCRCRRGYLQRGNGANLNWGWNGWAWTDFADYAASGGIRVAATYRRRCNCTWSAYLQRVEVRETRNRYYTYGYYMSDPVDRNVSGHKGYDWGQIWWSCGQPSGCSYYVDVRGSNSTTFSTPWQNVAYAENINPKMGSYRYLQFRVRLYGPGTFLPDANGTPTFYWIKINNYYDNNFNDPEAHDNEFWYDSTASYSESGTDWNSGRVINGGTGIRLNQYTALVTYSPSGSYYVSPAPCTYAVTNYTSNYYPPNGGTITRAECYLIWVGGGCSCRCRRGYLQKATGANLDWGFTGWSWRNFTDYPASQGIRVSAMYRRRCNCTWSAYLRKVEVSELKYYTSATYTSRVLDYGDTGFSWSHMSWRTVSEGGGRLIALQIRAAADAAFTMDVLNWTAMTNDKNLAPIVGETRRYLQFRVVFTGLATSTPELDWLTIKYYTDAKPTITITSTDKGVQPPTGTLAALPPDRWMPVDDGWHEKPPLTGNPANDYLYATEISNTLPVSQIGINVSIADPESDPIRTTFWEFSGNYTDDGDDTNDMWFMINASDMEWSDEPDITKTKAVGSYKILWKNINNYLAGVYQDIRFRCKANDLIFDSDLAAISTPFFVDENVPPAIDAAAFTILPDPAYTTDTLTLNTSTSASDPDTTLNNIHDEDDNNILSYITSWDVNGVPVAGITQPVLPSSYFIKGDVVTAKVYPYDGKEFGPPRDKAITIQNKPPVITSITLSPATPYTDDDLICTVVATDDDEFIWRETDFRSATVDNVDNGAPFDPVNCDGNITTTDVDQDNEWELQLK
jgi:hypothetical protein